MKKERFSVINESKFERLSKKELQESKGGICWSCMRRTRKVQIGGTITGGVTISANSVAFDLNDDVKREME